MLELTNTDFPMGRHEWNLAQGKTFCDHEIGSSIPLTFSMCYPGEFTCDSGQCIPLEDRCNIELNCEDQADEYNCAAIKTGNEYGKENIPVSLSGEPIIIYINVSILALPSISTKDVKFTVDFHLNLRWYDLRLDTWDLNHDFYKNSLSRDEIDSLWIPKLAFVNSLGQLYSIRPLDGTLIRESDPLEEDISLATEGELHMIIFNY